MSPAPDPHLHLAFLAGGRGTRFWPLSRRARPKQVLDITGEGPMLRVTRDRLLGLAPTENHLVVTGADLAAECRKLLDLPSSQVLAEPLGRNTAPAVGLALLVCHVRDPKAVLLALPSDHHVGKPKELRRLLLRGVEAARSLGSVVLFGAVPDRPATEYGYLSLAPGDPKGGPDGLRRLAAFKEKPAPAGARRLVKAGAWWNSGMFCLPVEQTLEAIDRVLPELGAGLAELRPHVDRRTWRAALARIYPGLPSISFDHGVLERLEGIHALPMEVAWSDVASWESLAELLPDDGAGNRVRGPVVAHDSTGCVLVAAGGGRRRLVSLGMQDLVLVDCGDVVFACPRGRERDVAGLLKRLERSAPELL